MVVDKIVRHGINGEACGCLARQCPEAGNITVGTMVVSRAVAYHLDIIIGARSKVVDGVGTLGMFVGVPLIYDIARNGNVGYIKTIVIAINALIFLVIPPQGVRTRRKREKVAKPFTLSRNAIKLVLNDSVNGEVSLVVICFRGNPRCKAKGGFNRDGNIEHHFGCCKIESTIIALGAIRVIDVGFHKSIIRTVVGESSRELVFPKGKQIIVCEDHLSGHNGEIVAVVFPLDGGTLAGLAAFHHLQARGFVAEGLGGKLKPLRPIAEAATAVAAHVGVVGGRGVKPFQPGFGNLCADDVYRAVGVEIGVFRIDDLPVGLVFGASGPCQRDGV